MYLISSLVIPDFDMAVSWQRLIEGKHIPPDIVMLQHELMEMSLIRKGLSQKEAHDITNKKHNYSNAIGEWKKKNGKNNRSRNY